MVVVTPAQIDPRATAFRVREGALLRFVPAVGDVEDIEAEEDEPTDELGEEAELDSENTAGDDAELGTGYGVKGNVDNGNDENSCVELETTEDQGVDVAYNDETERAIVDAINEGAENLGEVSELLSTLKMVN